MNVFIRETLAPMLVRSYIDDMKKKAREEAVIRLSLHRPRGQTMFGWSVSLEHFWTKDSLPKICLSCLQM
jgi:hypothetical protein